MKYKGPKPEVENHYHIQDLIDSQEKRVEERTYYREKAKNAEERQKTIDDSKMLVHTDFHCSRCNKDFKQNAVLQVEVDWSNETQCIAYYKGKHRECGRWSIRLVTDKQKDSYWTRSKLVAIDRGSHHNDLIQPHETGFNLLYGKPKFTQ